MEFGPDSIDAALAQTQLECPENRMEDISCASLCSLQSVSAFSLPPHHRSRHPAAMQRVSSSNARTRPRRKRPVVNPPIASSRSAARLVQSRSDEWVELIGFQRRASIRMKGDIPWRCPSRLGLRISVLVDAAERGGKTAARRQAPQTTRHLANVTSATFSVGLSGARCRTPRFEFAPHARRCLLCRERVQIRIVRASLGMRQRQTRGSRWILEAHISQCGL